jgi:hypothetical protein
VVSTRELYCDDVWDNASAWLTEIGGRLKRFLLRAPERVDVTTTLDLAGVSIGDTVRLTTSIVRSRYHDEGGAFDGRRLICVGGGPDWLRGTCRLSLIAVPPRADSA